MAGFVVDLYLIYQFIKRLTTPFDQWDAYKLGVIDKDGNILKKASQRKTTEEKDSLRHFDLLILNLKKLMNKVGLGGKFASYAAAYWLITEHYQNKKSIKMLAESAETEREFKKHLAQHPFHQYDVRPTRHDLFSKHPWFLHDPIFKDGKFIEPDYLPPDQEKNLMGQYDMLHTEQELPAGLPANSVGSGQIAGVGVGPKGEPGLTPDQMKKYKEKNKSGEEVIRRLLAANLKEQAIDPSIQIGSLVHLGFGGKGGAGFIGRVVGMETSKAGTPQVRVRLSSTEREVVGPLKWATPHNKF